MKHHRIIALMLVLVMALSLTACGEEEVQAEGPAGVAVQVQTVLPDTIATENKVSGKISTDNSATIMIGSRMTGLHFLAASRNAILAAILYAISLESTSW